MSFVHEDGSGHRLVPVPPPQPACIGVSAPSGFVVASAMIDLDRWLARHGAPPLAERHAVLAYGSNACPSKLTWLRGNLGLSGPVVVLRARCRGVAAVWAAGFRTRDGQRPATLAAMPDAEEDHAVLLATGDQIAVFDRCEGAGHRYHRVLLPSDDALSVTVDGHGPLDRVHAYVGARGDRMPLLVDGRVVPMSEMPDTDPRLIRGVATEQHGFEHLITVSGTPARPLGWNFSDHGATVSGHRR